MNEKEKVPGPTGYGPTRMNAKSVLEDRLASSKRYTQALQVILSHLDWDNLSREEEEVLWSFFNVITW